MASLLDIAPSESMARAVSVRGQNLEVPGLGIGAIAGLVARFPSIQGVLSMQDNLAWEVGRIGPDAVAAIIASGTGHHFDADHEAAAKRLQPDEQLRVLNAIWKATAPNGPRPLAEALVEAGLFSEALLEVVDSLLGAIDGAQKTWQDSQNSSSS